ncbi:glycosyltransferase family 2 protein [Aquabacter sp. L1I39]|uniref:glycosyltransferase family 2 protein n=1 Tax=Aquabacter sp. L1I39 TaxID=2820278 RepID=UPI001ADCA7D7|nr:glycosyltransferase family 2 protein [Aquabacter sp. L1I39]QTL02432.1 glycosyltransferase family 2 protein [Aquabacter sp. L1I39]
MNQALPSSDLIVLFQSTLIFQAPHRLSPPGHDAGHVSFVMWAVETWKPRRIFNLGSDCENTHCAALQASVALDIPLESFAITSHSAVDDRAVEERQEFWSYLSRHYGTRSHRLTQLSSQILDSIDDQSLDMIHVSGCENVGATRRILDQIKQNPCRRAVILIHGIFHPSEKDGIQQLWHDLSARHPSFSFEHCEGLGVVFVGTAEPPPALNWLLKEVATDPARAKAVRQVFARLGEGVAARLCAEEHARRAREMGDTVARLSREIAVRDEEIAQLQGAIEERDSRLSLLYHKPGLNFDPDWYLATYPDVGEAGLHPLTHYIAFGAAEGRLPNPAMVVEAPAEAPSASPYDAWVEANALSDTDVTHLRKALAERTGRLPKISIVTPVFNTDPLLFEEMIQSARSQIYEDWELCLVDDGSTSLHVGPMLKAAAESDPRIRVTHLPQNSGISVASNEGVKMAKGEIIAFLDHDDIITNDCIAEIAIYYSDHPDADIVYSDDDKIDMDGKRYAPQFKPDWSPVLLLSFMYMAHILTVRRSLFLEIGGFRAPFDGAQDFDFALRASEHARHVGHIPKVLYHWRAAPGSTASSANTKPLSFEAGRRAVEEALMRRGFVDAKAVHPEWASLGRCGIFEVEFGDTGPSVTIVIPTFNKVELLKSCITSLAITTYKNYDILIVDNESTDPDALAYLEELRGTHNIRIVTIASPNGQFSYANLNNRAILGHCRSEFVLLLNNDTQVISPRWLSQMVGYARMPKVGAVGARLYFHDGTIQHAGVVHGYHDGLPGHAFRNAAPHDWGYMGFIRASREYSAVTAACMLTPYTAFEALGGFDEMNFSVAYNDVDYCYRLVEAGFTCIYCAGAELFHFEGRTRGFKDNPQEQANYNRLYGSWEDRWYNPNLSLANERFEPATIRTRRPTTPPPAAAPAISQREDAMHAIH